MNNETENKTVETNAVVVSYGSKIQIHARTVEALTKLLLEQEKIDKKWLKVADMLIGDTAWFFVGGDQPTELQRLERMLIVLLTVHALRGAGHRINRVCLYQLLTDQRIEWSVAEWPARLSGLLVAFIQARVQHAAADR